MDVIIVTDFRCNYNNYLHIRTVLDMGGTNLMSNT